MSDDDLKKVERILTDSYISTHHQHPRSPLIPSAQVKDLKIKFHHDKGCKILSFKQPISWDYFCERIRLFNHHPDFTIQRRTKDGQLGQQIHNISDLNAYIQSASEIGKLRVHVTSSSSPALGSSCTSRSPIMHKSMITSTNSLGGSSSSVSRSASIPHSIESGVDSFTGRSCTDFNVIRRNMLDMRRRRCSGNSSFSEEIRPSEPIGRHATTSGSGKCTTSTNAAMMSHFEDSLGNEIGEGKSGTYPKRAAPIPKCKDGINSVPRFRTPNDIVAHPQLHNQKVYIGNTGGGNSSIGENSITPQLSSSRWDQLSVGSLSRASSTSSCLSTDSSCPWQRGNLLGRGSFGVVYQCMDRQTGMEFAIKEVLLTCGRPSSGTAGGTLSSHGGDTESRGTLPSMTASALTCTSELEAEMEVLRSLDHHRIVHYYGVLRTQRALYVCMEYLPEGSLYRKLDMYGPLAEPVVRNFTKQILQGLAFLHQKMIVHRDLKAANILCDRGELKLADFGTAVHLNRLQRMMDTRSFCGTPYWMAPELLRPSEREPQGFSLDTWSLGATVIEMLTGNPPYYQMEVFHAAFEIRERGIPEEIWPLDVCTSAGPFLALTFQMNSRLRPIAADLLSDPFVQNDSEDLQSPSD